jgi:hypothetical protein
MHPLGEGEGEGAGEGRILYRKRGRDYNTFYILYRVGPVLSRVRFRLKDRELSR